MTSSFGVTELQLGDTPETLLARGDRALLMAKENGRNRVVQLGAGQEVSDEEALPELARSLPQAKAKPNWLSWFRGVGETLISAEYLASVPPEIAMQKLAGFINDHKADVVSMEDTLLVIRIDGNHVTKRLAAELTTSMLMNVEIKHVEVCTNSGQNRSYQSRTMFSVSVRPYRGWERRSGSLRHQAKRLLLSFQAYLVAHAIDDELREVIITPR